MPRSRTERKPAFQSTPPARGATFLRLPGKPCPRISIHAPREGGDPRKIAQIPHSGAISIHAPREGGDPVVIDAENNSVVFQSTPPARGATAHRQSLYRAPYHFNPRPPRGGRLASGLPVRAGYHFNPRPPRGGRRVAAQRLQQRRGISIHAPREGGDSPAPWHPRQDADFNPRPPRGGRQQAAGHGRLGQAISIHAPREGGDHWSGWAHAGRPYFNPRPPRGGRLLLSVSAGMPEIVFQSTPPARGATPERPCPAY